MKRYFFVCFTGLMMFASCLDVYKEETGAVLDGTWTLVESYTGGVLQNDTAAVRANLSDKGNFLVAREFDGENLLLFYTGGLYDSSFYYRIDRDVLFVRRVMDTADVIFPILDTAGNISGYDTVAMPQKPLSPQTGFEPEKYYGHVSLKDGSDPVLTIERYTAINDKTGEPSGSLVQKDVYQRPEQDTE